MLSDIVSDMTMRDDGDPWCDYFCMMIGESFIVAIRLLECAMDDRFDLFGIAIICFVRLDDEDILIEWSDVIVGQTFCFAEFSRSGDKRCTMESRIDNFRSIDRCDDMACFHMLIEHITMPSYPALMSDSGSGSLIVVDEADDITDHISPETTR